MKFGKKKKEDKKTDKTAPEIIDFGKDGDDEFLDPNKNERLERHFTQTENSENNTEASLDPFEDLSDYNSDKFED